MPRAVQYCQFRTRERVLSYLGESDADRIKDALLRAYETPDYEQTHTALVAVHADLLHCNRSAAQWLEQDLDQTLTLHRTGSMSTLRRSLRTTRCLTRVGQKLNKRLKEVQHWLPPMEHRGQMRKLDRATALSRLFGSKAQLIWSS